MGNGEAMVSLLFISALRVRRPAAIPGAPALATVLRGAGGASAAVQLITFSRRAAAEMARRAGRLLHEALNLPASTAPPVLPWCGTFHSIAVRLLREEAARVGLPNGFTVLDRADAQDLLLLQQAGGMQQQRLPFDELPQPLLSQPPIDAM